MVAGARVCLSDVNRNKGEATLKELQEKYGKERISFTSCDVTNEEEIRNLFDKAEWYFSVDCVDIFANNAGINCNAGWRKCMTVNIISVMNGAEIAMERMKRSSKTCQIINTSSLGVSS